MARKRPISRRGSPSPSPGKAFEFPPELTLLALSAPTVTPPAHVKQKLLARIRAEQHEKPTGHGAAAWRFDSVRSRVGWLAMPFPGIRMKELSVDTGRNTALVLLEMAANSRFPDHEHEFSDEGIILSGDVRTGGRHLGEGDYYYGPVGSKHDDIVTEKGCTALVHMAATVWERLRARGQLVEI